jgi:DNA-binding beta-propeller fold protein YncE
MKRQVARPSVGILLALTLALGVSLAYRLSAIDDQGDDPNHEIWIVDQSDTRADGGGTLYIYQGDAVAGHDAAEAVPEVIDLGDAARTLCLTQTGTAPRRPHLMLFNVEQSHAVIAFVATGHVLFVDAPTRTPVGCVDVGVQAHAAFPSPDSSYVVVANQNGKLLQRIATDYATNTFTLDNGATLDLANCITPNGLPCQDPVLRPDNAPICPAGIASNGLLFETLRGGGLFVVDTLATPMRIVGEYDRATIHPNGCGGVELNGKIYLNSGGGTASNPLESDLYRFFLADFSTTPNPPNTPLPTIIFSQDDQGFVDSHGVTLTRNGRFLWVGDRAANKVVVVDTTADLVVNEFSLLGEESGDPAPDLMDRSPSGQRVYVALRGPSPLTGNVAGVNNAVGSTPGLGVIRVQSGGLQGALQAIAPITNGSGGVERADPHAVRVRAIKH